MPDWDVSTWIGAVLGVLLAMGDARYPARYFDVRVGRFTWGYDRKRDRHG